MKIGLNTVSLKITDASSADSFAAIYHVSSSADRPFSWSRDVLSAIQEIPSVRGITYIDGNNCLISCDRSCLNRDLSRSLEAIEGLSGTITVQEMRLSRLARNNQRDALRVLLNSMHGFLMDDARFANMSGRCYWRLPSKDVKDKNTGLRNELVFLEFDVGTKMQFALRVKTFTRTTLKNRISFTKKLPFEAYPLYRYDDLNMVSVSRGTVADDVYISRVCRYRKKKQHLDFYSFLEGAVSESKVGVLAEILDEFRFLYGDFAELEFGRTEIEPEWHHETVFERMKRAGRKDEGRKVWEFPNLPRLAVVDGVGDALSLGAYEVLTRWIDLVGLERKPDGEAMLNLVHERAWYEDTYGDDADKFDAYLPSTREIAIQNIAIETLMKMVVGYRRRLEEEGPDAADAYLVNGKYSKHLEGCVGEAGIKRDVTKGTAMLASMPEDLTFLAPLELSDDGCELLGELRVTKDGKLAYQELTPFELEDTGTYSYDTVMAFQDERARVAELVCVMVDAEGNENIITETDYFTIPEDFEANIAHVRAHKGAKTNKAKNEEILSLWGIGVIPDGPDSFLYYCGSSKNINSKLANSCNMRRLEALGASKVRDDLLPSLLDVDIVRLRMLTVVPWPLKYLREYHEIYKNDR